MNDHIAPSFKLDVPFIVMGLLFVALALAEYFFPAGSGGDRLAIKVISGVQIAFALIVAFFSRRFGSFFRWVPLSFILLFLWLCFSGIIRFENLLDTLYHWVMYFFWFSLFVFFYIRSQIHPERVQAFLVLACFSLLVWVLALIHSSDLITRQIYLPTYQLRQNYIGYYIVALFPFALMLKAKSLRVIAIALITYGAVYSLKRGAILALVLMGFCSSFLYIFFVSNRSKRGRNIIALISVWAVALVVGGLFVRANWEVVEHRLNQASNREEVYRRSFEAIGKSEIYEIMIGHGSRQSEQAIKANTHNDWLFLLYDYGIVGVVLMLNVYLSLMWMIWKLCKLKSPLSLPLLSSLILMACVQQYSIGLYLKTFGFITGGIGLVVGSYYAGLTLEGSSDLI